MTVSVSTVLSSYASTAVARAVQIKSQTASDASGAATGESKATISAQALLKSTQAASIPASTMSRSLHANPDKASVSDFVQLLATNHDDALVSVGATPNDPAHYLNTGEVVTPESTASFNLRSQQVLAGRTSLYNQEVAKGTNPADIYDKMVSYMKALPADGFKSQVSGWGSLTG